MKATTSFHTKLILSTLCTLVISITYCSTIFATTIGNYNIGVLNIELITRDSDLGKTFLSKIKALAATLPPREFEDRKSELISVFFEKYKKCLYNFSKQNNFDAILDTTTLNKIRSGTTSSNNHFLYFNGSADKIMAFLSSHEGHDALAHSNIEDVSDSIIAVLDGKTPPTTANSGQFPHTNRDNNQNKRNSSSPVTTNTIPITKEIVENITVSDSTFRDYPVVFKNKEFSIGEGIGDDPFEYGTIENIAYGDLNNDGVQDAAFIAWFGVGTSFQQYYLFAVSGETGKVIVHKPVYLDDRIRVISLTIKANKIYWKAKVHLVHFNMASPPKDLVSATFKIANGKVEQDK